MGALGVALGGVQLVPLVEALRDNFREGAASLSQVRGWALPWRRLIAFLMPNFFGGPTQHSYYDVFAGETVGVARFRTRAGVARLSEIVVRQDAQGQGVGTALLADFETQARAAGCHKLALVTDGGGPARRFYEGRGYRVEGTLRNHYHGLDFVAMSRFPSR